jgi:hypothetical protein
VSLQWSITRHCKWYYIGDFAEASGDILIILVPGDKIPKKISKLSEEDVYSARKVLFTRYQFGLAMARDTQS